MEDRKPNLKTLAEMRSTKSSESPREDRAPMSRTPKMTAEERRQLIARAAYFRSERRGFTPGSEQEDWFAAEAEVDRTLARGGITRSA